MLCTVTHVCRHSLQIAVLEPQRPYDEPQILLAGQNTTDSGTSTGFILASDLSGQWQWMQVLPRSSQATAIAVVS